MQAGRPSEIIHLGWVSANTHRPVAIRSTMTDDDQLPPPSPITMVTTSEQYQDHLQEQLDALAEEIDYSQEELDSFIDAISEP
jgi:hypothetical protein